MEDEAIEISPLTIDPIRIREDLIPNEVGPSPLLLCLEPDNHFKWQRKRKGKLHSGSTSTPPRLWHPKLVLGNREATVEDSVLTNLLWGTPWMYLAYLSKDQHIVGNMHTAKLEEKAGKLAYQTSLLLSGLCARVKKLNRNSADLDAALSGSRDAVNKFWAALEHALAELEESNVNLASMETALAEADA